MLIIPDISQKQIEITLFHFFENYPIFECGRPVDRGIRGREWGIIKIEVYEKNI